MKVTRLFFAALVILILGIQLIPGQTTGSLGGPNWPMDVKDFEVSIVNVMRMQSMGNISMPSSTGMPMGSMAPANSKGNEQVLQFAIKSKNTTDKTIAMIQWETRFTNTQNKPVVMRFKTKKKIKPGKDETIEETGSFDPRYLPETVQVGFRIMTVQYTDNTAWENCADETESCFIYKTINFGK